MGITGGERDCLIKLIDRTNRFVTGPARVIGMIRLTTSQNRQCRTLVHLHFDNCIRSRNRSRSRSRSRHRQPPLRYIGWRCPFFPARLEFSARECEEEATEEENERRGRTARSYTFNRFISRYVLLPSRELFFSSPPSLLLSSKPSRISNIHVTRGAEKECILFTPRKKFSRASKHANVTRKKAV